MSAGKAKAKAPKTSKDAGRADVPLHMQVRAWMRARDAQDGLVRRWQEAERRLAVRAKPLGLTLVQAERGKLPEARSMRALMRRIRAADRRLHGMAAEIASMQPASAMDAVAMLEMARRILQPDGCPAHVWELLNCGVGYLRERLAETS